MMTETTANPPNNPPRGRQSVPIEQRVEDALILMEDLADLLDDETDAVARHDFARFAELQAEKVDMATEYQGLISRLQKRQAELKELPEQIREALAAASSRLDEAVEENERQIDAARRGTNAIIDTIIEAARKSVAPNDAYTQNAEVKAKPTASPTAVSVNEEL